MTKVNGVRICKACKGICHEGSWRQKFGERKEYFCCESHLRNSFEPVFTESEWIEFRDRGFEQVDAITA